MVTFENFKAAATLLRHPSQRAGQFAFNLLRVLRPDLADEVRRTECDPFYDDIRLAKFWDYVEQNWWRELEDVVEAVQELERG